MRKLKVMDGQTDGPTDGRTGGVAITPIPGPTAPAGDNKGIDRFQLSLSTIWRNHLPFNQ